MPISEHAKRNEMRPLSRHRSAPSQLDPANIDIPSHDTKPSERIT